MRALSSFLLLALTACLSEGPEGTSTPFDACSTALAMQHEALDMAMTDPPQCVSDEDCVSFSLGVSCDEALSIGDCPRAVHRAVAERYDAKAVNERICKAVRGAEYGCFAGPSCVATGPVVCQAGACTTGPFVR